MTLPASPTFTPIYTTVDNVKVRLANKVQFQKDPNVLEEGEVPDSLLGQLIVDAETVVEQDLRSRYQIPIQSCRTGAFVDLPDHSQRAIRRAVDLACVIEILNTDFGRGGRVDAAAYFKNSKDLYDKYIDRLLGRDPEAANDKRDRFRFSPPLDQVRLAPTNREADDGYKGMIINTDASHHDAVSYAEEQINDPSKSYLNRRLTNPAGG